ncbi:hypothetical protein DYB26_013708 [Aphanomyces astaci]|uniref:Protein phosphatase n=1 Tax=Aphanomyces astaci TaxID=112090 RepID=A0A397E449_APHAT|nr:hypothetical protein DYB38_007262 [Aphanomyces astaci]RHZ38895.1 hypothetical protein DYB26_013708 [Aphanomyces astaci]
MLHRVAPHVMKGRWMTRLRYPSSPSAPRSAWNNEWRRHMRSMTAADLLNVAGVARSQKASVVSEDDTLVKAVETMAAHHNSSTLVVVDTEDRVVGLLTQHRILTQISQHLGNWPSTLVRLPACVKDAALPSRDIVHVTPEDTLQDDIPQFVLHSFAMSIPHPQKVESGGEDAFFLGTVGTPDNCGADVLCFGVSDGVGSWFEQGFSASKLMKAAQAAATVSLTKHPHVNPSEVLHAAWQNVSQKSDLKTAEKRGTLDGSLTRKMKNRDTDLTPAGRRKGAHVSYRSPQQLHYFNCPFQLGYYVPDIPDGSAGPLFETPREAVNLRVPVEEGDLIILATDGLFDNVVLYFFYPKLG